MDMSIGSNIKRLRLSKNLTQDQLAQKLKISPQAVSKWENGAAAPDIMMLPELSALLGTTIDELFSLTDEVRFERIDNMLYDVRFLPEGDFRDAERYLREKRGDDGTRAKATLLLAMLYNKRADEYHALASPLAREALELSPGSKDAHNAVFDAENGPYEDWNFINHHGLIDFYKGVCEKHPEDRRNYYWLLDLLIADGRTAEAREWAERMRIVADTYHYEMYMSRICKEECDLNASLMWLERMRDRDPDQWIVHAEYADAMAKLCRYDEAVESYKKAMDLRPRPRFVDCEEAVAHLCELKGDYAGAIEMQERIIEIMKSDWDEREGEGIDAHLREIDRLRARM